MWAGQSQNLPPVLELTEAAYDRPAAQLPRAGRDPLTQRAGHLASCVRFGLDDPGAMRRLHDMTGDLANVSGLDVLLPRVLDGALSLTGADFGNIQLLDPVTGA